MENSSFGPANTGENPQQNGEVDASQNLEPDDSKPKPMDDSPALGSIPGLDQNQPSAALSLAQDNSVLHANRVGMTGFWPFPSDLDQFSPYEALVSDNAVFYSTPPHEDRGVRIVVQAYLNSGGLVNTVASAPAANQNPGPAPANGPVGPPMDEQAGDIETPPPCDPLWLPLVPPAPPCFEMGGRWYCSRCDKRLSRRDELRRHLRRVHYPAYYDEVPRVDGIMRARMDCP